MCIVSYDYRVGNNFYGKIVDKWIIFVNMLDTIAYTSREVEGSGPYETRQPVEAD